MNLLNSLTHFRRPLFLLLFNIIVCFILIKNQLDNPTVQFLKVINKGDIIFRNIDSTTNEVFFKNSNDINTEYLVLGNNGVNVKFEFLDYQLNKLALVYLKSSSLLFLAT